MAISSANMRLMKPERLTDFPDGGGRMIGEEIVDGVVNNLFNDVAAGDRVFGRVSLRAANLHVNTPDQKILAQAIGIIITRPVDPAVNVVMFSTGSSSDTRADAQRMIETFRLMANESSYVLYGNHPAGTTVLTVFGRQGMPAPSRGDVFMLSVESSGHAARTEPVKVNSILYHQTEEFLEGNDTFYRDVMQIELTRSVSATAGQFLGMAPRRDFSLRPPTLVRATRPNESTRFYGTQPLETSITASPAAKVFSVKVPTPYQPLVPAAQSESPIVDQTAGMGSVSNVQSGPSAGLSLSFSASAGAGVGIVRFLGMGFARGSLSITAGSAPLIDDGSGGIVSADFNPASPWGGIVDYDTGRIEIRHETGIGGTSFAVTATPAAPVIRQSFTREIPITVNNQFASYVAQLRPVPAPGTVITDSRMSGQWSRLQDNGLGGLAGNPGDGNGTVNYSTGSTTLSLPALPDIDSSIIYSWGTPVTTFRRDGDADIQPPYISHTLAEPCVPGSLAITYLVSSSPVVVTDDGNGNLLDGSSNVIGSVVYATGETGFRPPVLPDSNSQIGYAYDRADYETGSVVGSPAGGGATTIVIPTTAGIEPGSASITFIATSTANVGGGLSGGSTLQFVLRDRGNGTMEAGMRFGSYAQGVIFDATINYATGEVVIQPDAEVPQRIPEYGYVDGRWTLTGYTTINAGFVIGASTTFSLAWQEDGAAETAQSETIDLPPVRIDLLPLVTDHIVPGSLKFVFGGRTYVDRMGTLYYGVDPLNNAGTAAGTVDYASGVATLTGWAAGGSNALTVSSLLTRLAEPGVASLFFRTPGSPVQAGSFIFAANTMDGSPLTATSNVDGDILGDHLRGHINVDTGVVRLEFGDLVTAAGNEAEPWYDPELVEGGMIWRPMLINPATATFGVVVFEYVQVSPTILGLDPILLPNDGRVRIFRPGDQLVLIDEREITDTPAAEDVIDLGREMLSQIEVRDSAGTPVVDDYYTLDLDAGTVTIADTIPIGWAPYVTPLVFRSRVDVRRGILRTHHTGLIELTAGIDRDFDAATTLVCSALVMGERYGNPDIQARWGVRFDQATDEIGIFRDELVGNPATASYNYAAYPWVLTNRGAITERWKFRFTSTTAFVVIGEVVGQLPGTFSTSEDCAPINPLTITDDNPDGDPYFVIPAGGWGGGWAIGNIQRGNSIGADPRVWFARVTQPSDVPPGLEQDHVRYQNIGDPV